MYSDIPLWLSLAFMVGGLAALAWSSDVFVDGAAGLARLLGISPFVVGMVVIGFGTSAPELCVSALAGAADHSNLSLGNAYGSCIFNIAVILGVAAMIHPLRVRPIVALVAGPGLAAIALLSMLALEDGVCSRGEGAAMFSVFLVVLPLYCWFDQKTKGAAASSPSADGRPEPEGGWRTGLALSLKVLAGLAVLVGSSHCLVWGAVDFAKMVGVSDLVIGLTIVAAGTSLPELASAVAAARHGEHEFVLGNIIGSNLFNTLAVVGLATTISPATGFSRYIMCRDLPLMAALSASIAVFGANWRNRSEQGVVGRPKAAVWLLAAAAYFTLMLYQELSGV